MTVLDVIKAVNQKTPIVGMCLVNSRGLALRSKEEPAAMHLIFANGETYLVHYGLWKTMRGYDWSWLRKAPPLSARSEI